MFNEKEPFEEEVRLLIDLFGNDLERLFEELDITLEQVLTILLEGGHACLPPYILPKNNEQEDEEDYE